MMKTFSLWISLLSAVACTVSASSYFIHLSDPHMDFNYKMGANVDCTWRKMGIPCCHNMDANLTPDQRAPRFGHSQCDLPRETYQAVVETIAKDYPKPVAVVVTGDMASHDMFNEEPDFIAQKWDFAFKVLKQNFGNDIKIIATIGNLDAYPFDQMSENQTDQVVTEIANVMYSHGLIHKDVPNEDVFSQRGYYKTAIPNSNVDAVVMNNILDLYQNGGTDPTNPDPAGMYTWVEKMVAESAAAGRKVWIIGHVAPGYDLEYPRGVSIISRLVDKYGSTVKAAFFGHTHMDEFLLTGMRNLQDTARFVSLLSPGMTARSNIIPSARVVEVDGADLNLVDYHQFRVDLPASNSGNKLILNHFYDFRDWFEVPDMSPKSFQSISKRILTDEAYACKYLKTRVGEVVTTVCDDACRRRMYCLTSFRETSALNQSCYEAKYEDLLF